MSETLTPLENALTAHIDRRLATQSQQIRALEAQVATLMEEREQMRSMLDFVAQLSTAEESSQS